jgi:hypothetical protein
MTTNLTLKSLKERLKVTWLNTTECLNPFFSSTHQAKLVHLFPRVPAFRLAHNIFAMILRSLSSSEQCYRILTFWAIFKSLHERPYLLFSTMCQSQCRSNSRWSTWYHGRFRFKRAMVLDRMVIVSCLWCRSRSPCCTRTRFGDEASVIVP